MSDGSDMVNCFESIIPNVYSKELLEDSDQNYFEEDTENNSEFTDETLIINEEIGLGQLFH